MMPLIGTLPGCGGDNNGPEVPQPTAKRIVAPVQLSSAQRGSLDMVIDGNTVRGSLTVEPPSDALTRALTFRIPAGLIGVSGTLTAPRSFRVSGGFLSTGQVIPVEITGTIPTAQETGTYLVRVNGQTASGTIPVITTPLPLPSPSPSATPNASASPTSTAVSPVGSVDVSFSSPSSTNANLTPFRVDTFGGGIFNTTPSNGFYRIVVSANDLRGDLSQVGDISRYIQIEISSRDRFVTGQSFRIGSGAFVTYSETERGSNNTLINRNWNGKSGTLKIMSVESNSVSLQIQNARQGLVLLPQQAQGEFTLSGTIAAGNFIPQ
jgi:hypothetical protein